ncbi:MAG TPA: archease [Actinoallomurus sp.]|jgi:SHS2 domain-containing protein|nr:archease [Actinoallomurus sp.]
MGREARIGHRTVPTSPIYVSKRGPTAELCIAEAVRAMVYGFADLPMAAPTVTREFEVETGGDAAQQLLTLLDEVINRMEIDGQIPQAAEVRREHSGLRLTLAMTDATRATLIGAVPKQTTPRAGSHRGRPAQRPPRPTSTRTSSLMMIGDEAVGQSARTRSMGTATGCPGRRSALTARARRSHRDRR